MKLNSSLREKCHGCFLVAAFALCFLSRADELQNKSGPELTDRSLDELMNIEVRSVSRKDQTISQSAAAIYVISQEDIRRSGATTIAEALRMAPGLDVAQIDANKWAISSRGFNDFFANKLLVLNDGRSVYTPLFSGVFWDVQDTMLEDIERIEVIRGPGATLWGANAVDGVINIITKSSKDTQGGLLTAGGGSEERGFGAIRYGGRLSESATYRFYAKYFDRDDTIQPNGQDGADAWNMLRGGFRTDWDVSANNALTVQGDLYAGKVGQQLVLPALAPPFGVTPFTREYEGKADVSGGNLLGSWKHVFAADADLTLQMYYDRTEREDLVHHEIRDTYDLDFQDRFQAGGRNEIVWGMGYRYTHDDLKEGKAGSGAIQFVPPQKGDQLFSTFLQDEISLVENRLRLTLGSKFEHNDYTGFEIQPNGRLLWTPTEKHSIWASASRAVRTPSRFEHDIVAHFAAIPIPAPTYVQLMGNSGYQSEKLMAYELGYRVQPVRALSFDLATFYNIYDDLRTIEGTFPFLEPENKMKGETYGAEVAANWNVTKNWRLAGSYTRLQMQLHQQAGTPLLNNEAPEKESPENQMSLRSYLDLPGHFEFDTAAYYVDRLPARNVASYVRLDFRLGWHPRKNFELSLSVQNVLDDKHPEFGPGYLVSPTEIERSAYAKATWRF